MDLYGNELQNFVVEQQNFEREERKAEMEEREREIKCQQKISRKTVSFIATATRMGL